MPVLFLFFSSFGNFFADISAKSLKKPLIFAEK